MSLSLCKKKRSLDKESVSRSHHILDTDETTNSAPKRRRRSEEVPISQSLSQSTSAAESVRRCGKILNMHLTNFMCHSNLSIDFHPRINFLVGSNGSGKSAVLAALVLGLGSKAKVTNRSSSLKQLIKSGENSAKIEITFLNEGPQAFEADVYGDQITVVRTINQYGSNYAIKSVSGHVVSRKIDDLQRILMYHNVQADNPVFVLNQDNAREFLKELEPAKNYKLFLKATQIEMVMDKLNDCLHSHKDQMYRMECFKKKLAKNLQEINELKRKLEEQISVEKLKETLYEKELELLWLIVAQHETELQKFIELIEKMEEKKENLLRLVQNKDDVENELTTEVRKFENKINERNTKYIEQHSIYMQTKNKVKQMIEHSLEINAFIDSHKKRQSHIEAQIQDLQNHIDERANGNVADIAELRQRNQIKLSELHQRQEDNGAIIDTAKRDLKIFLDNKMQIEEKIVDLKRSKHNLSEDIRRVDGQIGNIKSSSRDKLSIYGEHVTQLLAEIQKYYKAGKFTEMPRGPIGRYIEVPNGKYRDVIESQLGGTLQGFIVSNSKDRITLDQILKQKFQNYRPVIITTKFLKRVYDVSGGRVQPSRDTRLLMDEIQCKDPIVMNCLIDRVQIETVLLADSKEVAEHLTAHSENVPYNLRKVIVPQHGLEYYPSPNYRMYSTKIRPARFIQVNVQDRINQLELEKQELLRRIETLDVKLINIEPELRAYLKRMEEKRTLLEQHDTKRRELLEKISEVENFDYPEYNEIDILRKELSEHEQKLEIVLRKLDDKKIELNKVHSEQTNYEGQLEQQKASLLDIQKEIDAIKAEFEEVRIKLRSVSNNFQYNKNKLKEVDDTLKEMQKEKSAKLTTLGEALSKAKGKGERIISERQQEDVIAEVQKLKSKLKHCTKNTVDPKKLKDLIIANEHTMQRDQSVYENIKISIDMLKKSLLTRFNFIKKLKQHMVLLLQFLFNHFLKLRNFVGSIEVNHNEKTLAISVIPRDNHVSSAVSSTRALSGGERSYTTVAFLISLWSCVDHPFYFLDEYDVFTDEVNREYMTRLLINEGKKRPHRQYTFLTPQDMALAAKDFIKIHKLAVPERR